MLSQFYLADLLGRAGISEYLSYIFIPILVAGIYDFFECSGKRTWLLGVGLGGLLLSHTIMALIGLLVTITFFVGMLLVPGKRGYITDGVKMRKLIITAAITFLCVAFYLLPMLEQMMTGKFYFNFPWATIGNNMQPFSTFFSLTGYFNIIAYVGVGMPVIFLMGCRLFIRDTESRWGDVFYFGGIVLFVMTTSVFPWELFNNTFLNMIQFTYRLYPYALCFLILGIMLLLSYHYREYKKTGILIFIIAISVIFGVWQNKNYGSTMQIDEKFLAENSYSVGRGEWIPSKVNESIVIDGQITGEIWGGMIEQSEDDQYYHFTTEDNQENYILPLIYYKGYSAVLHKESGECVELRVAASDDGFVQVYNDGNLRGKIRVGYAGTVIQKAATITSAITVISLVFIHVIVLIREKRNFAKRRYMC